MMKGWKRSRRCVTTTTGAIDVGSGAATQALPFGHRVFSSTFKLRSRGRNGNLHCASTEKSESFEAGKTVRHQKEALQAASPVCRLAIEKAPIVICRVTIVCAVRHGWSHDSCCAWEKSAVFYKSLAERVRELLTTGGEVASSFECQDAKSCELQGMTMNVHSRDWRSWEGVSTWKYM
jgi:hypothetical protein